MFCVKSVPSVPQSGELQDFHDCLGPLEGGGWRNSWKRLAASAAGACVNILSFDVIAPVSSRPRPPLNFRPSSCVGLNLVRAMPTRRRVELGQSAKASEDRVMDATPAQARPTCSRRSCFCGRARLREAKTWARSAYLRLAAGHGRRVREREKNDH